jgi:hypothetical protein
MFVPGLSLTNAAAKSLYANMSGLDVQIPVAINPDVMFDGVLDRGWFAS